MFTVIVGIVVLSLKNLCRHGISRGKNNTQEDEAGKVTQQPILSF
jgi:hypothetical protein